MLKYYRTILLKGLKVGNFSLLVSRKHAEKILVGDGWSRVVREKLALACVHLLLLDGYYNEARTEGHAQLNTRLVENIRWKSHPESNTDCMLAESMGLDAPCYTLELSSSSILTTAHDGTPHVHVALAGVVKRVPPSKFWAIIKTTPWIHASYVLPSVHFYVLLCIRNARLSVCLSAWYYVQCIVIKFEHRRCTHTGRHTKMCTKFFNFTS